MAIIKTIRKHRFTSVDSQLGENGNLSFAARGLALHLLCKPEGWEIHISELLISGKMKKTALRQAMVELEKEGYLLFCRSFEGKNKLKTYWQLFESPLNPLNRSRSWENHAIIIRPDSSPAFLGDDTALSSPHFSRDDRAGDLINIHDSNYSLGEVSPKTPLQSVPLRLDSGQSGEGTESKGLDCISYELNTEKQGTPPCASQEADLNPPPLPANPPAIAQNCPLFDSGMQDPAPGRKKAGRLKSAKTAATSRMSPASDPRAKHPAIQAVRDIMGRYPEKIVWDDIIAALGETPDLNRLAACRKEQVKRGINSQSLIFCLDWYAGEIPQNLVGRHPEKGRRGEYVQPY